VPDHRRDDGEVAGADVAAFVAAPGLAFAGDDVRVNRRCRGARQPPIDLKKTSPR
jgi:hypothetical protein